MQMNSRTSIVTKKICGDKLKLKEEMFRVCVYTR